MSTYYIDEKVFSKKDKYFVYDIENKKVSQITENAFAGVFDRIFGSVFSIGHKLCINNLEGKEEFILKKRAGGLCPRYDLIVDNSIKATIKRDRKWIKPRYNVWGDYGTYLIEGDILGKKFNVKKDGIIYGRIHKKDFSLNDIYEICTYKNGRYELFISITLAIDNSIHN